MFRRFAIPGVDPSDAAACEAHYTRVYIHDVWLRGLVLTSEYEFMFTLFISEEKQCSEKSSAHTFFPLCAKIQGAFHFEFGRWVIFQVYFNFFVALPEQCVVWRLKKHTL